MRLSMWALPCAAAALAVALAGCGAVVTFAQRGEAREARPRDCKLQLVEARPAHDWDVIGVLEVEAFSVRAVPRDDDSFLKLVGPAACKAGGDALIPGIDTDGRYVLATVLAWKSEPAAPATATTCAAPPAEPLPAPAPKPPSPPVPAPPPPSRPAPLPAPPPAEESESVPAPAPPTACPEGDAC